MMMNKKAGEMFENAMFRWRDNKGIGTFLIPPPLNDLVLILAVLQRVYSKSENVDTLIIVDAYSDRQKIIDFVTTQEDEENNKEFDKLFKSRKITILTSGYFNNSVNTGAKLHKLCMLYNVESVKKQSKLWYALNNAKWKLVIWRKLPTEADTLNIVYNLCPLLPDFEEQALADLRASLPIEEMLVDVTIPDDAEESQLLKYYDEYIATSINIFGSFEVMQQCRIGNDTLNVSAAQICDQIARENGWNEHLDMTSSLNLQIDNLYNPNNLKERASQTYEIIRCRSQLLSDYKGKLDCILKIVQEHKDDKILIINKRGDFANKVTNYINEMTGTICCGNYHDYVEPIIARDINGNVLRYKSGNKKGEVRMMGAKAQCSQNEKLFNLNQLNILSTTNAPNKELNVDVDVIVITSSFCDPIENFIYRLSNVNFRNEKIDLFTIYVKNSIEEIKLNNKPITKNHTIVNNCENEVEIVNNSDFVIVD